MSTVAIITNHPYEGADDGLYCSHDDPFSPDVDLCSMPREAHDHPCMHATRPHEHRGDGRLTVWARDRSWKAVVRDDGSVCSRDVAPTVARRAPAQVMAFLMSGRADVEKDIRREGRE